MTSDQQCKCLPGTWTDVEDAPGPCEKFEAITADAVGYAHWDPLDCVICAHREECHVKQ